ncbi:MarR family winged helix-turn-helix transcriptional regulator [Arthrobacter sp. TMS1-12-1]
MARPTIASGCADHGRPDTRCPGCFDRDGLGPRHDTPSEQERGPSSQVDLAHHLHVTRAAVTTIVGRLAAPGLVVREPSPVDRRMNPVTLTPSTWQVLGQHYRSAGRRVLALMDTMSATDADCLTRHLKAITAPFGSDP